MDLDNFPDNEAGKQMLGMVSQIYDDSYVGKWLFQILGSAMSPAIKAVNELQNEAFPETATWSLPYLEALYGIETDESLSEKERRLQLLRKRTSAGSMNPAKIELLVSQVCERNTKLVENVAASTFRIEIEDGNSGCNMLDVISTVNRIKQVQKAVLYTVGVQQENVVWLAVDCKTIPNVTININE